MLLGAGALWVQWTSDPVSTKHVSNDVQVDGTLHNVVAQHDALVTDLLLLGKVATSSKYREAASTCLGGCMRPWTR